MARKLVKRDWGQAKGGYSPFAKSSPKAKNPAPHTTRVDRTGCTCYDAINRVTGEVFTEKCRLHR